MEECVHTDKYEGDMSQSSSDHGNQVKNYVNISDNCGRSIQYPEDDLLCKESEDHLLPTSGLMTTKNKNEAESNMKGQQMNSNFSHSVDIQHRTDIRDTKGHICSICGSTLSCRSSLDKHVLIHTSKKPYHCAVCGQPLAAKDHVQSGQWIGTFCGGVPSDTGIS